MITHEYIANIVLFLTLVSTLFLYRKVHGFWLNPTCLLISFWILYVFLPLILVVNGPINPFAIIYIIVFLFFFGLSSFFFSWRKAKERNEAKRYIAYIIFSSFIFKLMFLFFWLVSLLSNCYFIQLQGISILEMFSSPTKVGATIASMRYAGTLNTDLITKLSNFVIYLVVYFGGILFAFDGRRMKYVFFTFLPVILILVFQSSKGILFVSIFIFYGCTILKNIQDNNLNFFSYRSLFKTVIICFVIIALLALSFISRGLSELTYTDMLYGLYKFFASYSAGHLYGFSSWFTDRYFNDFANLYVQKDFQLGLFTFKSIFSLFGAGQDLSIGIYEEYVGVNPSDLSIAVYYQFENADGIIISNIYTIFRGLISDFTLFGSILFGFVLGLLVNCVFYNALCRLRPLYSFVIIPFYFAFAYQTYVISTFTWITIPVVIVLICLIVFVVNNVSCLNPSVIKQVNDKVIGI